MNRKQSGATRAPGGAFARGALLALCCLFALVGCSITETISESTRIDYKSAGKVPSLETPPDLATIRPDERFNVPERQQRDRTYSTYQTTRATERPAAEQTVLPSPAGMRIERAGTERWLVVSQPAERLWPLVREFWQENGFILSIESPATGVMETDWAENRAKIPQDPIRNLLGRAIDQVYSSGERDKFRTRLETVQGGTEIYISHRGMAEVYTGGSTDATRDSTKWAPRPVDPGLEAEFLRRLMIKLGSDQERARTAVASASTPPQDRMRLTVSGDVQVLEIPEAFDRAWRRVGLALDRGGFTVEDRDRSQGVYFVRYIDPDTESSSKPGFMARLFSRSDTSKNTNAQQFRVRVEGSGETTQVTVLNREGQPLATEIDRRTGTRILSLLRDQL